MSACVDNWLLQAMCCADQEHCCPQGYKCDLTQKTCVRPGLPSMPWFRKQSDDRTPVDRHMCDAHTSCPKDDTCCFMKNLGKWGCCPLSKVRHANIRVYDIKHSLIQYLIECKCHAWALNDRRGINSDSVIDTILQYFVLLVNLRLYIVSSLF